MDTRQAGIRRWPLLALVVSSALLSLGALAPHARAAGPAYRGMQLHSLAQSYAPDMLRELDEARGTGANVVRVDVVWATYELLGPGRYDRVYRARVDRFMKAVSARRMKAVAMIHQTPCWGRGGDPRGLCLPLNAIRPPRDSRDYGRFVRYFAKRYRKHLAAIEVWNEPNNGGFFQANDRPLEYSKLVKAAYPQLKAVAPKVKLLAGALSGVDTEFLRALYHHGIRGNYDAISVHPYTGDGSWGPDEQQSAQFESKTFLQGLKLLRRTQLDAGDHTPVWASEFGWNTGAYRNMLLTPWLNGVDERTQARYLTRALDLLNGHGLKFVEGGTIYNLRDLTSTTALLSNFGLLRNDLSRKPSYAAVKRGFATISRDRQILRYRAVSRRRRARARARARRRSRCARHARHRSGRRCRSSR